MKKTLLINLIGGPGTGKTTMLYFIAGEMKLRGHNIEFEQEVAKKYVLNKQWDLLNDQYAVSKKQIDGFDSLNGKVDFIITDGSILHGLYFNRINPDNISNIEETEKFILDSFFKYNNINIYLERDKSSRYEDIGRIQTKEESIQIDTDLKDLLTKHSIDIDIFKVGIDTENISNICDFIEARFLELTKK